MKVIGINFSHNMFDDPYNVNAVKKASKELREFFNKLGVDSFVTFGNRLNSLCEYSDEFVTVKHSFALSNDEKNKLWKL